MYFFKKDDAVIIAKCEETRHHHYIAQKKGCCKCVLHLQQSFSYRSETGIVSFRCSCGRKADQSLLMVRWKAAQQTENAAAMYATTMRK